MWITLAASGELAAVDPATNAVETTDVGGDPCGIAFADGDLWVATVQGEEVLRFDLESGDVIDRVRVGDTIWDLQADEDGVWVALRSKADVVRIDPSDGKIVARIHVGGSLSGLAVTPEGVWVADELGDRVVRIDPDSNEVDVDRHIDGFAAQWFGFDAEQLWVASMNDDQVLRIDQRTGKILDRVDVPGSPLDLDVAGGTAWVPANQTGELWTVDVAAGKAIEGPTLAAGIFVAQVLAGAVWVLNFSGDEVYRLPL
ncbi:MAG: PQQ-binding-like beta-propeller repeat protein [Actinomycetota bacterium]